MSLRVIVTAFEPYDRWRENSSWLAMVEFTKSLRTDIDVTTRLYPVDFEQVRRRLEEDLTQNYDIALHLGQAPGAAKIQLEAVGLNVGGNSGEPIESYEPLVKDGPVAFRSDLPLGEWARELKDQGIPATLSYHAGTFLCNATLYLTHYLVGKHSLKTQAAFVHFPLADTQAAQETGHFASMSSSTAAQALNIISKALVKPPPLRARELA